MRSRESIWWLILGACGIPLAIIGYILTVEFSGDWILLMLGGIFTATLGLGKYLGFSISETNEG